MKRVGDMTREELKQLVGEMVEKRLARLLSENGGARKVKIQTGARQILRWKETSKNIDQIGWTAPAGAQTPLEMLREDRDR